MSYEERFEVIDLSTNESHGKFATLDEARGCVLYDRISAYAIWNNYEVVDHHE